MAIELEPPPAPIPRSHQTPAGYLAQSELAARDVGAEAAAAVALQGILAALIQLLPPATPAPGAPPF